MVANVTARRDTQTGKSQAHGKTLGGRSRKRPRNAEQQHESDLRAGNRVNLLALRIASINEHAQNEPCHDRSQRLRYSQHHPAHVRRTRPLGLGTLF